jgi:KDO2-lipid IV(A) lauroyltransferase
MPFFILHRLSDVLYFILYQLLGYRKKVVIANLKNSFPEKTGKEIELICRKYYRHLCDLFLEVFKTLTVSNKEMIKHCKYHPEAKKLFDRLADERKSVILVLGHQGNWEWAANSFSLLFRQQLYVIYRPLHNKNFDRLMYKIRTRFKAKAITTQDTYKEMLLSKRSGEVSATAFLADQTPQAGNAYWTQFLNQETPVFRGTEIIAKKLDYPIVYASIKKISRGYYEVSAEIIEEFPRTTSEGMVSELHTRKLEKNIIEQPETWLWSHKRWKHKKPSHLDLTESMKKQPDNS